MINTYEDVGFYTAIVTAVNRVSAVTATTAVTITDIPISGLVATNDSPTALGNTTTLSASVTDGTNATFFWAFGDGTTGNGGLVTHVYPDAGEYTAVVTASNSANELQSHDLGSDQRSPVPALAGESLAARS